MILNGLVVASGYIGAALSVGMVVPQLVRTLRNPQLAGVSAASWTITMTACFTWLVYGIKAQVLPQIPGNVLIFPGAATIALAAPARLTVARRAAVLAAAVAAVIVSGTFVRPEDLGFMAFGISLVAAFPQTVTSLVRWRSGCQSAVSIPAWAMRGGSQAFWLTYGLALHNGPIMVAAAVTLVSAVVLIAAEASSPHRRGRVASRPALSRAGRRKGSRSGR